MDEQGFLEYVQSGGQVETGDWMPDDYRSKLVKFIEMHGNSELMGVLPERDWILRAPTLQRRQIGEQRAVAPTGDRRVDTFGRKAVIARDAVSVSACPSALRGHRHRRP